MNCPVCTTELKIADRQGIEIDFCPKCRGVWLDRGELDKIIERSSSQAYPEDYDDDDDDDRHYGRRPRESRGHYPAEGRRREGFFSRLFDFD
ncbi:MAG: zf-TFIIB domain-containing protein [Gemmataceae bacterium]|nr:zf-TFIIB domain-containing protein [Gemmataceae bacterium]